MGKLTNLNPPAPIADSDIPPAIARDNEVGPLLGVQNPTPSTYGSVAIKGITGEKNGFAGVHFPSAFDGPTIMFDTLARLSGIWSPQSAFGWHWNYNKGKLSCYNSEPITPTNQRGTFIGFDKSTGSLPGFPGNDFPTAKTDFTTLYFSVGGQYSAHITTGGTYVAVSDRARKKNSEEVDYSAIFQKLKKIPIYEFSFLGESDKVRRMGPYAQDFYAAFKLGGEIQADSPDSPEKMLAPADAIGILLAAVKWLGEEVEFLKNPRK